MNFDLKIERTLDIPVERAWKAWTTPELICEWFCPKPWKVVECEIDLVPGGIFKTIMQSPEGEKHPNLGCFLEIVPLKKIVWTDVLLPGFQPADLPTSGAGLAITCIISFEEREGATFYTAIARHKNDEDRKKHLEMGFHEGWGICADQLVELMKANS
jgi:uncharacterized protein YndB with AHSA1/START domain